MCRKKSLLINTCRLFLLSGLSLAFGCGQPDTSSETSASAPATAIPQQVNLLSYRYFDRDSSLFDQFTARTGIPVNVRRLTAEEDPVALLKEGQAYDLLLLDDLAVVERGKSEGILQPFSSPEMERNVPFGMKDRAGYWLALTKTGIAFVYAKERLLPDRISRLKDLASGGLKGKVLLTSLNRSINRALLAGMYAEEGKKATADWLKGVVGNLAKPPQETDEELIRAIAAGEGDVAVIDPGAYLRLKYSGNPDDFKVADQLEVLYPVNKNGEAFFHISYVAMPLELKNRDAAVQLIEFLSHGEVQLYFSETIFAFPVHPMAIPADFVIELGGFKSADIDLNLLGTHNREARELAVEAGW